jgi:pimeloyl-ACP methyl ester carboxylesterase
MSRQNRLALTVAGRVGLFRRLLMARSRSVVRRHPDRVVESGVAAPADKRYLDRPDVREVLVGSLVEAYRRGSRGPAWEMGLYARPWGFRLEDIGTPVYLSHGEEDANAPVTMGRYLASVIPGCQATFHAGEGHLHFVDRLPEIFAAVCP